MQYMETYAATLERIANDVDAFESLASGLSAGLHAGVVDPDHLYTLIATQAASIRTRLAALASDMHRRSSE